MYKAFRTRLAASNYLGGLHIPRQEIMNNNPANPEHMREKKLWLAQCAVENWISTLG
jgi:hypothetical protein